MAVKYIVCSCSRVNSSWLDRVVRIWQAVLVQGIDSGSSTVRCWPQLGEGVQRWGMADLIDWIRMLWDNRRQSWLRTGTVEGLDSQWEQWFSSDEKAKRCSGVGRGTPCV
ncbi:hypothetical protein SESBI_07596 [Sesbania bispinosa]|nr:hypothetical protein SESBI_07596 [Sesbania bispinosa]